MILINFVRHKKHLRGSLAVQHGVMRARRGHVSGGAAVRCVCPNCPRAPAQVAWVPDPVTICFSSPSGIWISLWKTRAVNAGERIEVGDMSGDRSSLPGILAFSRALRVKILGEPSLVHFIICSCGLQ